MDKLKWLVVTHLGRFVLGFILLLTGIFSEAGTIAFLRTDWIVFQYLYIIGAVICAGQFLFLFGAAIYYTLEQWES